MGYEPMNESWQMAGERHETLGQYVAKTYLWILDYNRESPAVGYTVCG